MKKIILLFVSLIFFNLSSYAQQEGLTEEQKEIMGELFGVNQSNITIDIDKKLFPQQIGGMYMSQKPMAILKTKVEAKTFEQIKIKFNKDKQEKGITVEEKGSFQHNGQEYLYAIGTAMIEGKKMKMQMYAFKADDKSTATIIGMYELIAEVDYAAAIKKSALSAKVINVKK